MVKLVLLIYHSTGDFEKRRPEEWKPGDRAPVKKPQDNLKPEGEFQVPEKPGYRPGERPSPTKPQDNLRPEGDFERFGSLPSFNCP